MIEYFVEVPYYGIQEPVSREESQSLCYDLAQEFGFAEVCWYALNGKRVTEGEYRRNSWVSLETVRALAAGVGVARPPL